MRSVERTLVGGLALLMLAALPAVAQAQASFAGTWELDRFKSVYEPAATQPQRRVRDAGGEGRRHRVEGADVARATR